MRSIRWTSLAKLDFQENIEFLLNKWSVNVAQDFVDEVLSTEFILRQGNIDFQNTNIPNVKRCVLCKQIVLFYRILDDGDIEFLRFWNSYRDDSKLRY